MGTMTPVQFKHFMDHELNGIYHIIQEKGQRIFRPVDTSFESDPEYEQVKMHEVFLNNLPNDLFENELLPFLCRAGSVYVIRTIMNFSGTTKGMAYVIFASVEAAFLAVETLNNEYIRQRGNGCTRKVHVRFSVNNCRLLMHSLPREKSLQEVRDELVEQGVGGIAAVKLFNLEETNNALITFESHQLASDARRILVPKGSTVTIFGQRRHVEWAKPKDFKTLYVRFNCSFINQEMIRNYFESTFSVAKPGLKVTNVKIQNKNAFVKFLNFSQANTVMKYHKWLPPSDFILKEFIHIENISWPIRK